MDKVSEDYILKQDNTKEKQRSALLLFLLYILIFFLLALLFPKENDQVFVPMYYLAAVSVLQLSYVAYYRPPLKSWSAVLLIIFFVLFCLFLAFSVYITGLAAAYQH